MTNKYEDAARDLERASTVYPHHVRNACAAIRELQAKSEALQAKLDATMLEHCPDEMTDEQVRRWEECQVNNDPNMQVRIDIQGVAHLSDDDILQFINRDWMK